MSRRNWQRKRKNEAEGSDGGNGASLERAIFLGVYPPSLNFVYDTLKGYSFLVFFLESKKEVNFFCIKSAWGVFHDSKTQQCQLQLLLLALLPLPKQEVKHLYLHLRARPV